MVSFEAAERCLRVLGRISAMLFHRVVRGVLLESLPHLNGPRTWEEHRRRASFVDPFF